MLLNISPSELFLVGRFLYVIILKMVLHLNLFHLIYTLLVDV